VHPEVVRGAGRRRVGYAGRGVLDRGGHPRLLMASVGEGVRRSGEAQGDAPSLESSEREVRTMPRGDMHAVGAVAWISTNSEFVQSPNE
jgi:hypothetical protein